MSCTSPGHRLQTHTLRRYGSGTGTLRKFEPSSTCCNYVLPNPCFPPRSSIQRYVIATFKHNLRLPTPCLSSASHSAPHVSTEAPSATGPLDPEKLPIVTQSSPSAIERMQKMYPLVTSITQASWKFPTGPKATTAPAPEESDDESDPGTSAVDSRRGPGAVSQGINKTCGYLQGPDGKVIDGFHLSEIRRLGTGLFRKAVSSGVAAATWLEIDSDVREAMGRASATQFSKGS